MVFCVGTGQGRGFSEATLALAVITTKNQLIVQPYVMGSLVVLP